MTISEEYQESYRKCKWCGKPKVSVMWSGKKGIYCSFRCSAAGTYRMLVAIAILASLLTAVPTIWMVMVQSNLSISEPIPLILIFPIVMLIGLDMSFVYAAFVGRSMRRERNINL